MEPEKIQFLILNEIVEVKKKLEKEPHNGVMSVYKGIEISGSKLMKICGVSFDKIESALADLKELNIIKFNSETSRDNPTLYSFTTLPDFNNFYPKLLSDSQIPKITPKELPTKKVKFDEANGIISYNTTRHTFHSKNNKKDFRLPLFKILWPEKMIVENNETIRKGRSSDPAKVALSIKFIETMMTFERNTKKVEQFENISKGMSRTFRNKKIPLKIKHSKKEIQLIIEEIKSERAKKVPKS